MPRYSLIALLILGCVGCDYGPLPPPEGTCENREVYEFRSPDGEFKAVRFRRWCGSKEATWNVSVLPSGSSLPNEPGNALAEQIVKPKPRTGYSEFLGLAWTPPHARLEITRNPELYAGLAASEVAGVQVEHSTDVESAPNKSYMDSSRK